VFCCRRGTAAAPRRACSSRSPPRSQLESYEALRAELGARPADAALAWLLHHPVVTGVIIGPRTVEQLTGSWRALALSLSGEALRKLDEIWPASGREAPQAYAW
jgi:aryl-alcohol dehydrogenase-like predicted oxidoreductase